MTNRPSTATSAISSAISEDFDLSRPEPPSATTQHGYTQVAAPVRATQTPEGSVRGGGRSATPSTRPQSPTSTAGRTHVPSLTAHGFSKPMNAQRLQAQRMARPNAAKTGPSAPVDDSDRGDFETETRKSMSTIRHGPYGPYAPMPEHERAPPSRGTEFTDPVLPDRATNASPVGNTTARSLGDHVRLLNERSAQQAQLRTAPQTLSYNQTNRNFTPPQKSPLSFRSGFGSLGSKRQTPPKGHQFLPSNATSAQESVGNAPVPEGLEQAYDAKDLRNTSQTGKNHEYFQGNTAFWLGGRVQNARDRPVNLLTLVVLVLPAVLFFIFSAPWLWHHVSPAIPIVFAYLFYVCTMSFIHGSVTDPGIIPRNIHPFPPTDPNTDPLALGPPTNDWVMIRLAGSETAAMDVPVKYCKSCNIWRPPRCYHCRVCDNCVETLDHHCVWLNNCVGRRNYRYFFAFVSTGTLLGLLLTFGSLGHCVAYRNQHDISFAQSIDHNRVPFAMFIYGLLATPYPISLTGYHLFLASRGETTREYLNSHKFAKADRHRPFTQDSFLMNWIAVLNRPRPPTYLHFKKQYQEGDQRFGPRYGRKPRNDLEEGGMEMKRVKGSKRRFEGPMSRLTGTSKS